MHNPNQVYILQRELVYISTGGENLQKVSYKYLFLY